MTLKEAYNYGVYFLSANNVDEAEFKSLCVVCHLAGIKNSEYQSHKDDEIMTKPFADRLWRIKNNEPLQYVLGKWDFYESEFYVGEGVLIPRPETEELVETAINSISQSKIQNPVVYDLCSGSGCIGISVAKKIKNATVYCVEKSNDALKYLYKNADGVDNVKVVEGDITNNLDLPNADFIISNPPYIRRSDISSLQAEVQKEPLMALDGGEDGLDFYRIINDNYADKLNDNSMIFLEIGENQGNSVKEILANSFKDITVKKDMYSNDRIVFAYKK
jgi:release factor glutamine methyltransferase